MSLDPLLSSETDQWFTPPDFFGMLDAEFHFTLDPCASAENATCDRYFTVEDDGLRQEWTGTVYMNPPYGRVIGDWVRKAWQSAQRGATVVCLIPARTDTTYWHEFVMRASEVRLVRGRLCFIRGDGPRLRERETAPFPSAVVIFRPGETGPPRISAIASTAWAEAQDVLDFGEAS